MIFKKRLPKICITSPWNYPLFNPEIKTHFGGWEVRMFAIARGLAKLRFEVNMVVGDHGQPHKEVREGVVLYSWQGRTIWGIERTIDTGRGSMKNSRLRNAIDYFLHNVPKVQAMGIEGKVGSYEITREMTAVYDEIDADIYMVPGNSQFSGEVAYYTRQRGKKYIFLAGSDMDYYAEYLLHPNRLDMYGVPFSLKTYAIENADIHVVQSQQQYDMLKNSYGREGIIIKNPIDLTACFSRNSADHSILWVGKSDERVKRPSLILELARQMPEFHFIIIMTCGVPETHQECCAKAAQLPNVELVERVPFGEIERYFSNAYLHLNTSIFEGFPNTFLQAAKYGVPTIGLQVDPGEMLSQHGCGFTCGGDFSILQEKVRALMTDTSLHSVLGSASLRYVRNYHENDMIIRQYVETFESVLGLP
jgi:glycosyltransferase involved in cell wall biosynthesis